MISFIISEDENQSQGIHDEQMMELVRKKCDVK